MPWYQRSWLLSFNDYSANSAEEEDRTEPTRRRSRGSQSSPPASLLTAAAHRHCFRWVSLSLPIWFCFWWLCEDWKNGWIWLCEGRGQFSNLLELWWLPGSIWLLRLLCDGSMYLYFPWRLHLPKYPCLRWNLQFIPTINKIK